MISISFAPQLWTPLYHSNLEENHNNNCYLLSIYVLALNPHKVHKVGLKFYR